MFIVILLLIAYLFGVNFYAFLTIKNMRKEEQEDLKEQPSKLPNPPFHRRGDGRLALCGLLGGALTVYACMFAMKYKLKNMFLMLAMPVLAVLNIYLVFVLVRYGVVTWRF